MRGGGVVKQWNENKTVNIDLDKKLTTVCDLGSEDPFLYLLGI